MSEKKFKLPSLSREQLREIGKVAFTLFLIVGITALLLAVVNELTYAQIEKNQTKTINEAMATVLPAESYDKLDTELPEGGSVSEIYTAKDASGADIGYCVRATSLGFGGELELVVGVDTEGAVTMVSIVSMSETPGVGTKTKKPDFLDGFKGKSGILEVTKGEVKSDTQIAAVSGATVSSKAVTAGVNAALEALSGMIQTKEASK